MHSSKSMRGNGKQCEVQDNVGLLGPGLIRGWGVASLQWPTIMVAWEGAHCGRDIGKDYTDTTVEATDT